jgi:hypothetical protein
MAILFVEVGYLGEEWVMVRCISSNLKQRMFCGRLAHYYYLARLIMMFLIEDCMLEHPFRFY